MSIKCWRCKNDMILIRPESPYYQCNSCYTVVSCFGAKEAAPKHVPFVTVAASGQRISNISGNIVLPSSGSYFNPAILGAAIIGGVTLAGLGSSAIQGQVHTCPMGMHWDPKSQSCVADRPIKKKKKKGVLGGLKDWLTE